MDEQGKETPQIGETISPSNWRAETQQDKPTPKQNVFQRLFSRLRGKAGETTEPAEQGVHELGRTAVARREQAEAEKVANQPLTREAGEKALHSEPDQPTASEPES